MLCLPVPPYPPSQNVQAVLLPFTRGTALHNVYLRALGARVAPDAVCDAEDVSEYDLIELQAGAFVGGNTVISPGSKQAVSNKQVCHTEPGSSLYLLSIRYAGLYVERASESQ